AKAPFGHSRGSAGGLHATSTAACSPGASIVIQRPTALAAAAIRSRPARGTCARTPGVVTTPGVLAHVPRAGRERIAAAATAAGRWITIDALGLHAAVDVAWSPPADPREWPNGAFALALDGDVLAAVDPLGASVEWRRGAAAAAQ
ncbi:MAG: hypothetical protein J0I66_10885, partial [Microbacterium sp.]|nr:hypothetical protein [Microbacterium sp.]